MNVITIHTVPAAGYSSYDTERLLLQKSSVKVNCLSAMDWIVADIEDQGLQTANQSHHENIVS